jgi:hypothetical protein
VSVGPEAARRPELASVLSRFRIEGEPTRVSPLRVGLIHESYVATCRGPAGLRRYLLQRLNARVFPSPEAVMENLLRVTDHLRSGLTPQPPGEAERRVLTPLRSLEGPPWHVDADGHWWRAYAYVERSRSFDRPERPGVAGRAAEAFGAFVAALADLPAPRLHETLPGFHDTVARYQALQVALAADTHGRAGRVRDEARRIAARAGELGLLHEAVALGEVPERVVHNDTKLNNVLFDAGTGEVLCVVDLDTVMPGLALHDFGDLVRSTAAAAPEDTGDPDRMRLSLPLFREVAAGWLAPLAGRLTATEVGLLPVAPRIVTLELAIRFLTDFLQGDRYFRVERPEHNLARCRAQLALAEDMERREPALAGAVREALGG